MATAKIQHAAKGASNAAYINNPILAMFNYFRDELDEHHDRRERVIKASRDITALSKKMYRIHQWIYLGEREDQEKKNKGVDRR